MEGKPLEQTPLLERARTPLREVGSQHLSLVGHGEVRRHGHSAHRRVSACFVSPVKGSSHALCAAIFSIVPVVVRSLPGYLPVHFL